jgi:hypothetical protein
MFRRGPDDALSPSNINTASAALGLMRVGW